MKYLMGKGGLKSAKKKCDVLFEWPLITKSFYNGQHELLIDIIDLLSFYQHDGESSSCSKSDRNNI